MTNIYYCRPVSSASILVIACPGWQLMTTGMCTEITTCWGCWWGHAFSWLGARHISWPHTAGVFQIREEALLKSASDLNLLSVPTVNFPNQTVPAGGSESAFKYTKRGGSALVAKLFHLLHRNISRTYYHQLNKKVKSSEVCWVVQMESISSIQE